MRFNKKTKTASQKTVNLAGGKAYKESAKAELVSILLTSFLNDQFYRSSEDTKEQVCRLVRQVDPVFAAKAAVFSRREFGLRSITHLVGGEIAKNIKGASWTKGFLRRLFKRPDDMLEITAYVMQDDKNQPIPNCLKRAIRDELHGLNEYSLAKYKKNKANWSIVDLVNLTHPKNTAALKKLVKGTLKPADTWETKLTQAGQKADSEEELSDLKSSAWKNLIKEKKLGYLALLRNLRNILEQAPDEIDAVCEQLTDKEWIKKSLIFPFQYDKAFRIIQAKGGGRKLLNAVSKAMDISCSNIPELKGKTAVIVDTSGSMQTDNLQDTATIFAAALYKATDCEVILCDTSAEVVNADPNSSIMSISNALLEKVNGGGTNLEEALKLMTKNKIKSDRIIILSDMQSWQHENMTKSFKTYCEKTGSRPKIFSFDLSGYGQLLFPEKDVYFLAGVSPKVFQLFELLEEDKAALIHRIEAEPLEQAV